METHAGARVSLDMSITHQEFFRCLERLTEQEGYRTEGNKIFIGSEKRHVEITLSDEWERKFTPVFSLTATLVDLDFFGYGAEEQEVFMKRFMLAFHRGGG